MASTEHQRGKGVDPTWPAETVDGNHAVSELISKTQGAHSPFGDDTEFPIDPSQLPYSHPHTEINR
jgi:hypothetical protein